MTRVKLRKGWRCARFCESTLLQSVHANKIIASGPGVEGGEEHAAEHGVSSGHESLIRYEGRFGGRREEGERGGGGGQLEGNGVGWYRWRMRDKVQ